MPRFPASVVNTDACKGTVSFVFGRWTEARNALYCHFGVIYCQVRVSSCGSRRHLIALTSSGSTTRTTAGRCSLPDRLKVK